MRCRATRKLTPEYFRTMFRHRLRGAAALPFIAIAPYPQQPPSTHQQSPLEPPLTIAPPYMQQLPFPIASYSQPFPMATAPCSYPQPLSTFPIVYPQPHPPIMPAPQQQFPIAMASYPEQPPITMGASPQQLTISSHSQLQPPVPAGASGLQPQYMTWLLPIYNDLIAANAQLKQEVEAAEQQTKDAEKALMAKREIIRNITEKIAAEEWAGAARTTDLAGTLQILQNGRVIVCHKFNTALRRSEDADDASLSDHLQKLATNAALMFPSYALPPGLRLKSITFIDDITKLEYTLYFD
eukprot:m.268176 g.268176  ORF g.268176 m.268176 type:complete len:297 (+) comp34520_c0_seq1:44-934(+)